VVKSDQSEVSGWGFGRHAERSPTLSYISSGTPMVGDRQKQGATAESPARHRARALRLS
jgi:hypothetical protein